MNGKKILSLMLAVTLVSASVAGYAVNAETANADETVQISELGSYTIVYPSNYTELRMDIVYLLQNTISAVTGTTPKIIPDTQSASGKEIIFASSQRTTGLEDTVNGFESVMDYVIAVKGGNIVLGGQNYWSDLRAVYDFVENYLGYDDIKNVYNAATSEVSGIKTETHQKPSFFIQAATWATVFTTAEQIKDIADANFNALAYTVSTSSAESLHFVIGQCVRFELYLVINRGAVKPELYYDCPIILGHSLWDEARVGDFADVNKIAAEYKEKYAQYGWKAWVNQLGAAPEWDYMAEMWDWSDVDVTGFDIYPWALADNWELTKRDISLLYVYNEARTLTQLYDKDFWVYIQSYRNTATDMEVNSSKGYRWQMYYSMCFGVDSIVYFMYANETEELSWADTSSFVMSRGFIKNKQYYDAQQTNKEIASIAELYRSYEQKGAYTLNVKSSENWLYLEDQYDFSYVIEDIKDTSKKIPYLVGCFDKKDGDGNAFILMSMDAIDSVDYNETEISYVKAKINGNKVTAYLNGEPQVLTPDADGYYSLATGNGICLFVTVE